MVPVRETALLDFARAALSRMPPAQLWAAAVEAAARAFDATLVVGLATDPDQGTTRLAAAHGLAHDLVGGPLTEAELSGAFPGRVTVGKPEAPFGVLLLGEGAAVDQPSLETLAVLLAGALEQHELVETLQDNEQRLADAQALAHMGSYDWDIAKDTNRWSDELYRIYGTEPQSFNASYERFLSFIHPDDHAHVMATHQEAFQSHEPYRMEERVVRPDGSIRTLYTTGEVVTDEAGTPIRMRGICWDITERKAADEAARRAGERFRALVESAPDAVLVLSSAGQVLEVNAEAAHLFGRPTDQLLGMRSDQLLEGWTLPDPTARSAEQQLDVVALRPGPASAVVDLSVGTLDDPATAAEERIVVVFARDARIRHSAERAALALHDEETRRRQAFEINDNVLQGLTTAAYALETDAFDLARRALDRTLDSARHMIDRLLGSTDVALQAGDLIREAPAPSLLGEQPTEQHRATSQRAMTVLIADDAPDIRLMLRLTLTRAGAVVVGEAANGSEAVEMATRYKPDFVLLDVAMPKMDGLEALPLIKLGAPDAVVVMLSGFGAERLEQLALDRGAAAYVEKGTAVVRIIEMLNELRPDAEPLRGGQIAASGA